MYPDQRILDPELAGFESQLQRFRPGPSRLDRDRLMYLAGRTAVEGDRVLGGAQCFGRRVWPSAFWGMTAVAMCLATALLVQIRPVPQQPPTVGTQPSLAGTTGQRTSGSHAPFVMVETLPGEAVERASPPAAVTFRFRRPDEVNRMLGRLVFGPELESRAAIRDPRVSEFSAAPPAQLDPSQRLTCLEYRDVLMHELTHSPQQSTIPPTTRKPSGA